VVKHIENVACFILTSYWQKNNFLHCTKFSPLSFKTASPGFKTLCMPALETHQKSNGQAPMYDVHFISSNV